MNRDREIVLIIEPGEKVHVVYRSLYEHSARRHFVGEVESNEGPICRVRGFAFIYDPRTTEFEKKKTPRVTIIDLAESGYVVNVINRDIDLNDVQYRYVSGEGLVATDNKKFELNINEFGSKS